MIQDTSEESFLTPREYVEDDVASLSTPIGSIVQEPENEPISEDFVSVDTDYDCFENQSDRKPDGGRAFSYRKRKSLTSNIFSAPDGVSPHRLTSSGIRKIRDGGSRLVFIWPKKMDTRGKFLNILAPLLYGTLVGCLCMNAIHLWPGEFLPINLPKTAKLPQPLIKCNVIEPLWFDSS
ncbi:uncharacterized protein LOC111674149 [Orussus abietinus]|uniref:uncharacterized protein LOC111674149 n=1 Tax=Orussus abietinus TaxID=222816 RepID=UPI000C715C26|nr:uncharacterized protein LOC111674149 [Orussus abietinus]